MASIQLNLLPDVKKEYLQSQRTKRSVISVCIITTIAALGLATAFFLLVYVVQPALIGATQSSVDGKSRQLREVADIEKYLTVQNQLKALPELHDGKVKYSRMFEYLKTLNPAAPNNVRFGTLVIDEETKEIAINGASDNFQAFTVFQDTLKNATVKSKLDGQDQPEFALFDNASLVVDQQDLTNLEGRQELTFSMRVRYNEDAFNPNATDTVLNVPKKETTGSAVNAPQLFQESSNADTNGQ